jgi:hypothetical protein
VLHHLKPRAGMLDHFQIHLVRLFAATHPVGQPLRFVACIANPARTSVTPVCTLADLTDR